MWCSSHNGKILFYLGFMLTIVGLGLVVMKYNLPGAILMCIGIFPLFIGFLIIVTHRIVDDKMRKKQAENAESNANTEDMSIGEMYEKFKKKDQ